MMPDSTSNAKIVSTFVPRLSASRMLLRISRRYFLFAVSSAANVCCGTCQALAEMIAVAEMLVNSVKPRFDTCVMSIARVRVGDDKPRAVRTMSATRMATVVKTETAEIVSNAGADAVRRLTGSQNEKADGNVQQFPAILAT